MPENRPRSREKNITGQGSGVFRRGEGLGTGPVGSGSSPTGQTQGSTQRSTSYTGATRRGGGRGMLFILIVLAVLFFGGRGIFGGSELPQSDSTDQSSSFEQLLPASTAVPTSKPVTGPQLIGGGSTWSGGGSSTWSSSANTSSLDTAVAGTARDKFTQIVGGGADQVTVMVYMCGSDLESRSGMASRDLAEMGKAKLSDRMELLVCTGGTKQWRTSSIRTDINQIFQIQDGYLINTGKTAGNKSMTSPDTLLSFINYCTENHPANRYILILWDHGGGSISGYGYDERFSGGAMSLAALSSVLKNCGVKFDFIGFDACLMATAENALMLSEYADYLIASEETEPGIGWDYTNWLTTFAKNTSTPTLSIGKQIVDDFTAACARQCPGQPTTLSVVDLAELGQTLPAEMRSFSESLKDMITGGDYQSVSVARGNTKEFASSTRIDQIDFIDFAQRVGTEEGRDLAKVLRSAVKYNRCSSSVTNAYGLSVYFPQKKLSTVDKAVQTYDAIGIDRAYTECIRAYASLETSAQISSGGSGNSPYSSLLGNYSGGYSSSGSDMVDISALLNAFMGGDMSGLLGFDSANFYGGRSLEDNEADAAYLAANRFDPAQLFWQKNAEGEQVISMGEEQWRLVQDVALNLFYDDGEGYIDLGLDNSFDFDDNGNLLPDTDGTWISLNGQPVAYYYMNTAENEDGSYAIMGYVPALLNGQRVKLILIFSSEFPQGYVAGAQPNYSADETDTVSRGLIELQDGDVLDFLCDYYSYDGAYQDSYLLGQAMTVSGDIAVSDTYLGGPVRILYRFTDIYQQNYWSEALELN